MSEKRKLGNLSHTSEYKFLYAYYVDRHPMEVAARVSGVKRVRAMAILKLPAKKQVDLVGYGELGQLIWERCHCSMAELGAKTEPYFETEGEMIYRPPRFDELSREEKAIANRRREIIQVVGSTMGKK